MNRCATCKFFGPEITMWSSGYGELMPTGFHACARVKHIRESELLAGERAFMEDGSGYFAALRVRDDFGCVEWMVRDDGFEPSTPAV